MKNGANQIHRRQTNLDRDTANNSTVCLRFQRLPLNQLECSVHLILYYFYGSVVDISSGKITMLAGALCSCGEVIRHMTSSIIVCPTTGVTHSHHIRVTSLCVCICVCVCVCDCLFLCICLFLFSLSHPSISIIMHRLPIVKAGFYHRMWKTSVSPKRI